MIWKESAKNADLNQVLDCRTLLMRGKCQLNTFLKSSHGFLPTFSPSQSTGLASPNQSTGLASAEALRILNDEPLIENINPYLMANLEI